jgi:hypothetical protein
MRAMMADAREAGQISFGSAGHVLTHVRALALLYADEPPAMKPTQISSSAPCTEDRGGREDQAR